MNMKLFTTIILSVCTISACKNGPSEEEKKAENAGKGATIATGTGQTVDLPAPFASRSSTKLSNVIGWPDGKTPIAPAGFTVTKFAGDLDNPRWIYVAPNGDIFVSEASTEKNLKKQIKSVVTGKSKAGNTNGSADRITLLRDADHDGTPELKTVFLEDLNQPFGMTIIGNTFYVANTDGVLAYPYQPGQTKMTAQGKQILPLPAGGYNNHWTRNLFASKDGKKIFVTVGSGSNVGENGMEHEVKRAAILEINPDGSGERIYAGGLRNPQGMGYAPGTNTLWVAVNERDQLGDDLVPDYITSVKDGGFYGWPYSYFGQHEDPRMKDQQRPELVKSAIVPDVALSAHAAALGLAFDAQNIFPGKFKGGAFIGEHGSWNRSSFVGYKVGFVPFSNGKPSGKEEGFLTGFLTGHETDAYGRPVGVAFTSDAMLVADDAGNTIWRVSANQKQ
jgi:glucose/arabinose dehydrogenase